MAERIDDIISPKAFEQVQKMNADIGLLVKNFESSATAAKLINSALSGSNSMQAVTQNIKAAAGEVAKLEAAQKRLEFANSEAGKELSNLNYQISEANRLNRALAKEMTSAEGSSSQLSAQLIRLRAQFDGMSESLRKSPLGQDLAKRINMVDTALKTLDSNTGRFQRNVGNYASATNSLSQVLREMPAFTYSAQTGILGISNNLPILIDQFRAVQAETGSASKAFKIFAGSLVSFPNILTIAIGLFTIFADKIFGAGESAKKAKEEIKDAGDVMQEAYNSSEFKQAIQNVTELETEVKAAKDGILDKDGVVKHYNETMGKTVGIVKTVDQVEQSLVKNTDSYLRMMFLKAAAHIALEEAAKKAVEAEKTRLRELDKIKPEEGRYGGFINDIKSLMNDDGSLAEDAVSNVNKMVKGIEDEGKQFEKIAKKYFTDAMAISKAMNFNFFGDNTDDKPKPTDDKTNAKDVIDVPNKMSNEEAEDLKKYYEDVNKWIEKYSKEMLSDPKVQERINQDIAENMPMPEDLPDVKATKLGEELKTYYAKKEKDARLKITKEEQQKKTQLVVENTAKMVQMAAEIMSIAADIQFQNEMAMIDARTKALEANYDSEIKRLERSGMSKEKIEKEKQRLEAQTEAQRKNIDKQRIQAQRRKARADKASDITNIITGTAVAVVNALKSFPPPYSYVMAALTGAVGAANLARAIATPLPQFAKGTNSAPGGLAEVGERGTELVIEPSGKKYLTPNKSTIMNVKKGSKIIPHHELMNQVRLAAMVKLSGQDSVSEMDYGNALIQAVIEQTEEQKRTRRAMERMNTTVIVNDNSSFQKWVTTYCK